jgi:hypothetical protein
MNIIDATSPADFPQQVIIMDTEFAARHHDNGFYLRIIKTDGSVSTVDLDSEMTLVGAYHKACEMGFNPTHWMEVNDAMPMHLNFACQDSPSP